MSKLEKLAEKVHLFYLEATKELHPESYNHNAQKSYAELTEEQRYIDRYVAKKLVEVVCEDITPENMHKWYVEATGKKDSRYYYQLSKEHKHINEYMANRIKNKINE